MNRRAGLSCGRSAGPQRSPVPESPACADLRQLRLPAAKKRRPWPTPGSPYKTVEARQAERRLRITLRDYARFGLLIAKGDSGPAGTVLPAGWIDKAQTPVWPATDEGSGIGWFWWVRQDGGYEAQGAYGQSITIYPKDDVVIAINSATSNPHGFGLVRWRLLQALDAAAVGRSDPNDTTK